MTRPKFSELEADATIELVNQAVGRAGNALAQLINEEVLLSVPSVQFVDMATLSQQLRTIDNDHSLVVVTQHFRGDFSGDAFLAIPERCSEMLVRPMLAKITIDSTPSALQQDALLEMGNIVLNACFGQLGDLLSTPFDCSFPNYINANTEVTLRRLKQLFSPLADNRMAMLLQVDLRVESIAMFGFLAFVMDDSSMSVFQNKIKSYLKALFN